ncbi:MAG TPA: hypothetical protein VFG24_06135 [Nitrosopumilaceae archaeon]|nr:hypothetical protein [Nitrosopumilaceae archaeon]
MKRKGIWLSLIFLASVLVVPLGYSNAEMENENNSQTGENETSSQTDENETSSQTDENETTIVNASSSAQENIGQQVSDFVHDATDQFKQQKNETRNIIKECREKIKDATNDTKSQVVDECHKKLQSIKEKYKDERQQFQELFKKFRQNIITLRHETNGTSSDHDKDDAIKKINEDVDKNGLRGLENALKHMKGMGIQHGKIGIVRAMEMVNKTRGLEGMSSNASLSQNAHAFTSVHGDHKGNDKGTPDEGNGKK